jgi:hypothetical protein
MWNSRVSADSREREEHDARGCEENDSDRTIPVCQLRRLTRKRNNRNRKTYIISTATNRLHFAQQHRINTADIVMSWLSYSGGKTEMDVVKVGFRYLYATRRERWSMCRSQVACLDIEQREIRLFARFRGYVSVTWAFDRRSSFARGVQDAVA